MSDPIHPAPVAVLQPENLRWLVCPVCRQPLALQADSVRCGGCARCYPIIDGIPILLADREN